AADEAEELADEAFDEMEERNAALDQPTAPPSAELPHAGERKERLTEMAQFFREDEDEGDARDDG
ncbi:MAG: hypothetical protein ACYTGX_02720, partial [Planctomycetota bacterium]